MNKRLLSPFCKPRFCLKMMTLLLGVLGTLWLSPGIAHGQEQNDNDDIEDINGVLPPDSDPLAGLAIYQTRCANCHGPAGMGDGELAANLPNPVPAIGSANYLTTADPQRMLAIITGGSVANGMPGFGEGANSDPLSQAQIWDVIAAVYNLDRLNQPVEQAQIYGTVENGTAGTLLTEGNIVLQAITPEFEEGGRFETPVQPDGSYLFDLSNLPPNWFYRVFINYKGLDFPSRFVALNGLQTEAELPLIVYDTTTDPAGITVDKLQILVDFRPEQVQVAEWYSLGSQSNAIFMGESGQPEMGTVELIIPDGAQEILLLQGFGGATDFEPILNPIVDGQRWRAPLPVFPGEGSMQLLIRYFLPYEAGMTIAHPLNYPVTEVDLSMPVSGARINTTEPAPLSPWQPAVEQATFGEAPSARQSFVNSQLPAGAELTFSIEGFPNFVVDAAGNQIINRNDRLELWLGGSALLLVWLMCGWFVFQWRNAVPTSIDDERQDLVRRLAALDLAYAEKSVGKRAYENRRKEIKSRLKEIW